MVSVLSSIFGILFMKVRGRVKIRVKSPVGEKEFLRKANRDGTSITVFKGSEKRGVPEWTFKFTTKALYFTKKMFMRMLTVDVFAEAEEAIEYDFSLEETKQPKFTKEEAERWVKSRSLKKYMEGAESQTKILTLIMLVAIILNVVLTLMLVLRLT